MAIDQSATPDTKCVCSHSFSAHGLRDDPGCSFCGCRRFERPASGKEEVRLSKYAAQGFELLSKHAELKALPKDAIATFVKDGHARMFAPGAYLVHRGDKSHAVHLVLSGSVTVQAGDTGGGQEASAGQLAGDLRAFTEEPRWASVYAADSVLALEIDTAKLRGVRVAP